MLHLITIIIKFDITLPSGIAEVYCSRLWGNSKHIPEMKLCLLALVYVFFYFLFVSLWRVQTYWDMLVFLSSSAFVVI